MGQSIVQDLSVLVVLIHTWIKFLETAMGDSSVLMVFFAVCGLLFAVYGDEFRKDT
jgi:uncharacterized membrane protein